MSERKQFDNMLVRILIPGVPWWVAVPCDALALVACVLLLLDPDTNLHWALAMLIPGGIALYGIAFEQWWSKR